MALYLVSYDISEKDAAEYQPLWDLLKKIGAVKILFSEWVVVADVGKAVDIYNRIAPLTKQRDRLLVQEMGMKSTWDKLLTNDEVFRKLLRSARF